MLQGAGLSLISPNSSVHTLILLWRSAKLVREIAQCYGVRPRFFATLTLLKIALENAVLQQGSDLLIDAGMNKLSEGVLSLLAEKGAEATVTSLLIRRLAKATIEVLDVTRVSPYNTSDSFMKNR
jgi:putative membrane protein